eukprot:1153623-Pelagomonas_calceolata.AAC.3
MESCKHLWRAEAQNHAHSCCAPVQPWMHFQDTHSRWNGVKHMRYAKFLWVNPSTAHTAVMHACAVHKLACRGCMHKHAHSCDASLSCMHNCMLALHTQMQLTCSTHGVAQLASKQAEQVALLHTLPFGRMPNPDSYPIDICMVLVCLRSQSAAAFIYAHNMQPLLFAHTRYSRFSLR